MLTKSTVCQKLLCTWDPGGDETSTRSHQRGEKPAHSAGPKEDLGGSDASLEAGKWVSRLWEGGSGSRTMKDRMGAGFWRRTICPWGADLITEGTYNWRLRQAIWSSSRREDIWMHGAAGPKGEGKGAGTLRTSSPRPCAGTRWRVGAVDAASCHSVGSCALPPSKGTGKYREEGQGSSSLGRAAYQVPTRSQVRFLPWIMRSRVYCTPVLGPNFLRKNKLSF